MWKDVLGFEDLYEVSDKGLVRRKSTDHILIGDINNSGYRRITLYDKSSNKKKRIFLHRLVAETFIPNENNLPEINHKDCNKLNNNSMNLEWCTRSYNEMACRKSGKYSNKRYTPYKVYFGNSFIIYYDRLNDLAIDLNVSKRTILNWLQEKSLGYKKFGINKIKYL